MKIGIVGAGIMGRGIAEVCARAGLSVCITDSSPSAFAGFFDELPKELHRLIVPCNSVTLFGDVDFVIEAVVEDLEIKREPVPQEQKENDSLDTRNIHASEYESPLPQKEASDE